LPGCRIAPLVLRWLFPEPPAPPAKGSVPPSTLVEAAAQAALVLPDRSAFRAVALVADLGARSDEPITRAALGPGLPVDAVLALLDRAEPLRLVDVLGPALLSAPAGPDLNTLLRRLSAAITAPGWDTPAGREVQRAVQLRALEVSWLRPSDADDPTPPFRKFARLLRPLLQAGKAPAPDLLAAGAAADVVDRIHGFEEAAPPPLVHHLRPTSGWVDSDTMTVLARRVAEAVRQGATTDLRLVLAAQLGTNEIAGTSLGPASWHEVAELHWTGPQGRDQHLLDHVVWLRMAELQRGGPDQLNRLGADARQWVERAVDEHRDHLDPHRALADYDRVAAPWWRRLGVPDDESLRGLARRVWRSS
jgi:hypothetical protein